jgi:dihydroneopterin aldolase
VAIAHERVRSLVAPLERDRVLSPDVETLAAAVADAILDRFDVARVRVRVRKPDVMLDPPVEHSAVTVDRMSER